MESKINSLVIAAAKNPPPIEPLKTTVGRMSLGEVMPFGSNNLFPNELAAYLRRAKVQRGIINSKTSFFSGSYFVSDDQRFLDWEKTAGGKFSLFEIHKRLNRDKRSSGNAYLILITDSKKSFIRFQHADYTKCRVDKNRNLVVNADWASRRSSKLDKTIPQFPIFDKGENGLYYSYVHFLDYESEFYWYGIPDWITGWENMQIDIRTDEWNLSHLDSGMKPDVIMNVPSGTSEKEIDLIKENAKDFKEGKPGSLLFVFGDNTKATVLNEKMMDMDWSKLNDSNIEKTLIANSWFKSLMSVSQSTGFDTQRIQYEYQLALRQIIPEQEEFLSTYKIILDNFGIGTEGLQIYNEPIIPAESKEDKLIKMFDYFTDEQKKQIGDKYFKELMNNE